MMRAKLFSLFVVLLVVMSFASAQEDEGITITLVSHDSFNVSEEVLAAFTEETGITVEILRAGDAGQMLNQSILSKNNPLGDVLFGVDNTFLSRALEADLFIPYESPLLEGIPEEFILDEEHRVTPIDYGDVCLNYDITYFEEHDLPVPESLADLTDPAYKGLLVVQNPATSSPGLAFLLATIAEFGTEGEYTYLDFWTDLIENDVVITDGWSEAYFNYFTVPSEDGDRPLVVSYASSPPVEFFFAEDLEEPTTAAIVADGTCFRQIEFAGILAGTEHEEAAQQFIDFLLSEPFQEDMPLQMFVFPVNPDAELPEIFAQYAAIPENPAVLDYADIEAHREEWIEAWNEAVLR